MQRATRWFGAVLFSLTVIACTKATSTNSVSSTDGAATVPCAPVTDPMAMVVYEAVTADGHYVVVISEGSTSRVFYGTTDHMVEGRVTGTTHSCAEELDFSIEGTAYSAVFAPATCNDAMQSRLIIGAAVDGQAPIPVPLTVLIGYGQHGDAGVSLSPADLKYVCL